MARAAGPLRLGDLAEELELELFGDASFEVLGVGSLDCAGPQELAFVRSAGQGAELERSRAGALVRSPDGPADSRPALLSANPALDFARVVRRLWPSPGPRAGVDPSASIAEDADLADSVQAGPLVSVGAGSRVGARTLLHAGVHIYADVVVGEDCILHAGVILREATRLGDRVVLQPAVVVGGDGFGYVRDHRGEALKAPQLGGVVIDDDVEIGAGSTVDRGTLDPTRIRRGVKIDNLVQIAHNCDIGEGAMIAAQVGLAGSTRIESDAILMGQVGSAGHLRVGRGAFVGARAGLHKDVPPGGRVWGTPQMAEKAWHRSMAALARLPDALRRLRALERQLGENTSRHRDARSSNLGRGGKGRGQGEGEDR